MDPRQQSFEESEKVDIIIAISTKKNTHNKLESGDLLSIATVGDKQRQKIESTSKTEISLNETERKTR